MSDTDTGLSLAERMAQVAAAASAGDKVNASTGEIIEERQPANQFGASRVSTSEHQQEQRERNAEMRAALDEATTAPPMQPGVGTTFVETPPTVNETVTVQAAPEVIPAPEPIRVEVPPPTPEPQPVRAEAPQPEPEIEQPSRTADAPYAASSMGQIIDMMERGGFSQECVAAFQALARGMSEIADATQKKQKGSITLKITLTTEGEAFFMEGDYKVTAPKLPRPRTIGWQTDDGRISPTQPRQQIMFGRDVGDYGERNVRPITDARVVRQV